MDQVGYTSKAQLRTLGEAAQYREASNRPKKQTHNNNNENTKWVKLNHNWEISPKVFQHLLISIRLTKNSNIQLPTANTKFVKAPCNSMHAKKWFLYILVMCRKSFRDEWAPSLPQHLDIQRLKIIPTPWLPCTDI